MRRKNLSHSNRLNSGNGSLGIGIIETNKIDRVYNIVSFFKKALSTD